MIEQAQPGEIHIRSATLDDCDQLGLIMVSASHKIFIGPVPESDIDFSWTPEISAANWRDGFADLIKPDGYFEVAEVAGQVVGYIWATAGAESAGLAWSIDGLYILPSQQKRGIGRQLLAHIAQKLDQRGIKSLEIGCLKINPSCRFYEHLGGVEYGRRPRNYDRYETEEILYGWPDITVLMKQ